MLPEYTVRETTRAKHVRFRVSISDGLVVVIPKGFDRRRIPGLLEEKREWVGRAMKQIEAHRADLPPPEQQPMSIELPAIGQSWQLEWREIPGETVSVAAIAPSRLRLSGSIDDSDAWRAALRGWLMAQGREHLIPWAERMAHVAGVRIERVSVRCQKTRWGSYSPRNRVSLNAQLLFLPERLVRYVILHELCHAKHTDHSPAFWNLLRMHEPDADCLRAELRTIWRHVPSWLQQGR